MMKKNNPSDYEKAKTQVKQVVDSDWFSKIFIVLIILNSIGLGLETYPPFRDFKNQLIVSIDQFILVIFFIELGLRIFAHGKEFFKDPWSLFDLMVVGVALLPANSHIAVLRIARIFRIMRILRLISIFPTFRHIVEGFISGLRGIVIMGIILFIIHYVYGIVGVSLFGENNPEFFETLPRAMLTLFQCMLQDGWTDVTRNLIKTNPYAWIFTITYVILTSIIMLNLVIAVMLDALTSKSMQEIRALESKEKDIDEDEDNTSLERIETALKKLATESTAIKKKLDALTSNKKL